MTELEQEIAPQVRVMQIIGGALAAGPVFYAIVLLTTIGPGDDAGRLMSLMGVGLSVVGLLVSPFALSWVANKANVVEQPGVPLTPNQRLATAYQTGFVAASSLLEGPAFLNLTAYLLEGAWWSLLVAGILVVAILTNFPTAGRVAAWIESKQRRERDEAGFGG